MKTYRYPGHGQCEPWCGDAYLNIFLSIFNVPMAITFKVFILELSVFNKSCFKIDFKAMVNASKPDKHWIENYGENRLIPSPVPLASGAHFPSVWTVFKTALVFIIFILELSVIHKSCLELNFQAIGIISRVPCTPVFLRSRTSGFQYWIF